MRNLLTSIIFIIWEYNKTSLPIQSDAAILAIIVDEEIDRFAIEALEQTYPTAPILFEPNHGKTTICRIDGSVDDPLKLNSIIQRVSTESSMEQVFALMEHGLIDQAKLLTSLPMKMVSVSTGNSHSHRAYYFPEEPLTGNTHAFKVTMSRQPRDFARKFTELCALYESNRDLALHIVESLTNPTETTIMRIIHGITITIEHRKLYAYFLGHIGSIFIGVIAGYYSVSRAEVMTGLVSKIDDSFAAAIDLAENEEYSSATSKWGIFDFNDIFSYAVRGTNSSGKADEYIESRLCELVGILLLPERQNCHDHRRTIIGPNGIDVIHNVPSNFDPNVFAHELIEKYAFEKMKAVEQITSTIHSYMRKIIGGFWP